MADVVRFTSPLQSTVTSQAVYLKARWGDDWGDPVPEVWASDRVWSVAPSISNAALQYRYGDHLARGSAAWSRLFPLTDRTRWYVKIVDNVLPLDANDLSTARVWIGIIDEELHDLFGPEIAAANDDGTIAYPRGRQHLVAYGMESILAQSWIDRAAYLGVQGGVKFVGRALAFNPGLADFNPDPGETTGEGNRSTETGPGGCYVFHSSRTGGAIWSTRDAVGYLLTYCVARDHNDQQQVPFFLDDPDDILPMWDQPIESCEGRKVFDLLAALVARQRGFAWRCEVRAAEPGQGPDRIAVVPCTFLTDDLVLGGGKTVKQNASQKILAFESDRGASGVIVKAAQDAVDQVIARGERRTSTATFSFADGTLAIGWSGTLETAYETAASADAGYPAAGETDAREAFNDYCRGTDKFRPVYARFVMPDPTETVGDGLNDSDLLPLMPSDDDAAQPTPHAPDDRRFLPTTALLEEVVYDGDAIGGALDLPTKPARHLPPLVLFPRPNEIAADVTKRWRHAEKIGLEADLAVTGSQLDGNWSAHVRVDDDDGALWVEVGNGLNWAIALTDFAMLPDDEEPVADYRAMLATLSVPWSFFAESRYPEDAPFGQDLVRRMIVLAPYRRLDYVAPQTVVALDEKTGALLRSDAGGFIRDDRDELAQIASLAFAWYGTVRQAIQFGTHLINGQLQLGDLIVSLGDPALEGDVHFDDVNSLITSIRLVSPLAESEGEIAPPLPRIEYSTAFGELDALSLLPRRFQR